MASTISKETRFKDLPESIKKKLISIHLKSHNKHHLTLTPPSFVSFEQIHINLSNLQTTSLEHNFKTCIQATEALSNWYRKGYKDFASIAEGAKKKVSDVYYEVGVYKKADDLGEFISYILDTLLLQSGRYVELKGKK